MAASTHAYRHFTFQSKKTNNKLIEDKMNAYNIDLNLLSTIDRGAPVTSLATMRKKISTDRTIPAIVRYHLTAPSQVDILLRLHNELQMLHVLNINMIDQMQSLYASSQNLKSPLQKVKYYKTLQSSLNPLYTTYNTIDNHVSNIIDLLSVYVGFPNYDRQTMTISPVCVTIEMADIVQSHTKTFQPNLDMSSALHNIRKINDLSLKMFVNIKKILCYTHRCPYTTSNTPIITTMDTTSLPTTGSVCTLQPINLIMVDTLIAAVTAISAQQRDSVDTIDQSHTDVEQHTSA